MRDVSISIITVTLNCADSLLQLVESLVAQEDQDFDWVVIDGGSIDDTLQVARTFPSARLTVKSEADFGIYDALNKGVKLARSDFYLVLGADDRLYSDAIKNFRTIARSTDWDIIAAMVGTTRTVLRPMRGHRWLRGGNAFVASHAVGSLIRRDLHSLCGYYSNRYSNCADMYFVLSAKSKANARIGAAPFVAGCFGSDGISSVDRICSISDAFRIQLHFGESRVVQLFLYFGRLIRALFFESNSQRR